LRFGWRLDPCGGGVQSGCGLFVALAREDVEVAGVGAPPAQVGVEAAQTVIRGAVMCGQPATAVPFWSTAW
jgi:hypothetical protein